jgi:hypothetical protein
MLSFGWPHTGLYCSRQRWGVCVLCPLGLLLIFYGLVLVRRVFGFMIALLNSSGGVTF